ncbi:MAG: histidine kinase, partial [Eubacterium sp.]
MAKCYREENYFFLNVWQDVFQEMLQYEENGSLGAVDIEEEKEILNRVFSGSYLLGASEENNRITYQIVERTFVKMVQKICAKQKVIFFIDDIHWMDSVSSQLLNRIILTCGPENTMLLCTMRINYEAAVMEALEPIVMKDWIRTIYLSPFSRAAVMEIIDQFCPDLTAEAGKKNSIYQMTWGSPFFLMEMIRIIREKGYTLEMSQKTINVIKCRFGSFSEKENKILDGMSIFPERVDVDELSFLLSMDRLEVVSSLDRLLEDQIVREVLVGWDLYYLFSHGMFKEYAYERQSLAKKVLFHRKIAEYYE